MTGTAKKLKTYKSTCAKEIMNEDYQTGEACAEVLHSELCSISDKKAALQNKTWLLYDDNVNCSTAYSKN
jgi:hypothetical protein